MNNAPFQVKRSSSFYGPLLILPKAQRQAMMVLYGFCRAVDDIADCDAPSDEKLQSLDQWQQTIHSSRHPALESIIVEYALDRAYFHEIIEGMRMDVRGEMICPTQADLLRYCDRVAGCVGQLAIRIFGATYPRTSDYATYLGRALQLTNILRDIQEDARMGRIYLPREAFETSNIKIPDSAMLIHETSPFKPVYVELAMQAQQWFFQAQETLDERDRKAVRPAQLMAMLYQQLLQRMMADEWSYRREYRVRRIDKLKLVWWWLKI